MLEGVVLGGNPPLDWNDLTGGLTPSVRSSAAELDAVVCCTLPAPSPVAGAGAFAADDATAGCPSDTWLEGSLVNGAAAPPCSASWSLETSVTGENGREDVLREDSGVFL